MVSAWNSRDFLPPTRWSLMMGKFVDPLWARIPGKLKFLCCFSFDQCGPVFEDRTLPLDCATLS